MTVMVGQSRTLVLGSGYIASVLYQYLGARCMFASDSAATLFSPRQKISYQSLESFNDDQVSAIVWATGPGNSALDQREIDIWRKRRDEFCHIFGCNLSSRHLVYISSGGTVYGEMGETPLEETSPLMGKTPYARYHIETEQLLQDLNTDQLIILRLGNPCGSSQMIKTGQGFIAAAVRALFLRKRLTIYGKGETIRDYICERDFSEIIYRCLESRAHGILNVGTGVGTSQNQIVSILKETSGLSVPVDFSPARASDLTANILDTRKLNDLIGPLNFFSVPEIINDMLNDFNMVKKIG